MVKIDRDTDGGQGTSSVSVEASDLPTGRVGVGVGWTVQLPNRRHYRAGCTLVAAVDPALPPDEREAVRLQLRSRAEIEVVAELESLDKRTFMEGDYSVDLNEDQYYKELIADINSAQRQIVITSPFPGKRMNELVEPLGQAAERGVEVVVLTKPENDQTAPGPSNEYAGWQTESHWNPLRDRGVRVEHRTDKMHEKIATIDGEVVYIGSQNPTSHKDTTELTLRIKSTSLASAIATKYHPDTGQAIADRDERLIDDVPGGGAMVSGIKWSSSAPAPGDPPAGLFGGASS